jgi:hypothetical protein
MGSCKALGMPTNEHSHPDNNPEKRPFDPLKQVGNLPPCQFILSIQGNSAIIEEWNIERQYNHERLSMLELD